MKHLNTDPIGDMRRWVEKVAVGLNFCPFAKREVVNGTIRYRFFDGNLEASLNALYDELVWLDENSCTETTLLILGGAFGDFDDYLELLDISEALLCEKGYEGTYQIASFHPDYQFEGEHHDARSNLTNRAPHPVLHLLRESSIHRATSAATNPLAIPDQNKHTLEGLDDATVSALRQHTY